MRRFAFILLGCVVGCTSSRADQPRAALAGRWSLELRDSLQRTRPLVVALEEPLDSVQRTDPGFLTGHFAGTVPPILEQQPLGFEADGHVIRSDSAWFRLGAGSDGGEIEFYARLQDDSMSGRWCQIFYSRGRCGLFVGHRVKR